MKAVYFAWVRERIGRTEEQLQPPTDVSTVGQLIDWLKTLGEEYEHAFAAGKCIRAAVDRLHVDHSATIVGATEVAFFPPMTGG